MGSWAHTCYLCYLPQVPKRLAEKVRKYYQFVVEREVRADEADIIAGLSSSLRTQVRLVQSVVVESVIYTGRPDCGIKTRPRPLLGSSM